MSRRLLAFAACCAVFASPAIATVHDVPGDFATVEAAVLDASVMAGDSIRIAPGTYEVEVLLVDKGLTFLAANPAMETVLTGNGQHRIFTDIAADVTLVGLTLESAGSPDAIASSAYEGGAMRIGEEHQVLIEDCVFRGNKAGRGSAIMSYSDLTLRNCLFEDNSNGHEFPVPAIWGGAVLADSGTELLIESCVFRHNRAGAGGGVAALGSATVRDSEFDDNFGHHNGGGLWVASNLGGSTALVEDCLFTNNWSSEGGGLGLGTRSNMTVRRCEFRNNTGGQNGGALSAGKDGPLLVEDCEFIENFAVGQGGAAIFLGFITNGATIRTSFFKDNEVTKILSGNGGGALWLIENSNTADVFIEDCTFVDNVAIRGSVATIQDTGDGPFVPQFRRCIMAYNTGSLYWCSLPNPQGSVASVFTDCTLAFENSPTNDVCGTTGDDYIIPGPDDTQVFCDSFYTAICEDSLAGSTACGLLGGLPTCGNCVVPTVSVSWGTIKSHFGGPGARTKSTASGGSKSP